MKTLTKQVVFILSILIAYLVSEFVYFIMGNFKKVQNDPFLDVAIGMVIIVIVFYPLYEWFRKLGSKQVEGFIRRLQEGVRSEFLGLLIGFIVLIFLLYCTYAWIWKKITVMQIIHKIISWF